MIDYFSLALTHGLLLIGLLRLLTHEKLDRENVATQAERDDANAAEAAKAPETKLKGRARRGNQASP